MEVPPCVVTLDGMAFETILLKCNGLLITKRFIYIFIDVDIVIICINSLHHTMEPKCKCL